MDHSAETPPNPAVETLIANISHLMHEAELMLNDSTSHHAEDQVALLRTQYGDLQMHFATLCDSLRLTATAAVRETDRTIREYPYRSLGIALGVGVLLGFALRRDPA
jgi:ElaB/YqjD/DUF883 family membrane-anchored ribosome-binding protein